MEVKIGRDLTVARVAQVRTELLAALEAADTYEIDLAEVEEIDAAGLQLLCSFHRAVSNRGLKVSCAGGSRGAPVTEAMRLAGFARHQGCVSGCLWEERADG
jgi:anti-anti-sigma regulatory factor